MEMMRSNVDGRMTPVVSTKFCGGDDPLDSPQLPMNVVGTVPFIRAIAKLGIFKSNATMSDYADINT